MSNNYDDNNQRNDHEDYIGDMAEQFQEEQTTFDDIQDIVGEFNYD